MPVKIRGNDYITVAERVTAAHEAGGFSMLESFPVLEGEHPYWRTIILVGERQFIGTAQIKFDAKRGTADGDSPLECAETSALGRALGFAGFGVVDGIASADEMARVTTDDPLLPREVPAAPKSERKTVQPETVPTDLAGAIRALATKLDLTDAERAAVFARHKGKKNQLLNVWAELAARLRAEQTGMDPVTNLAATTWKRGA